MTTNRLKHTEPSSSVPTGGDTIKARALESLSADQSALEDKTPETYSPIPVQLMELVVDDRNMLQAWRKVKANKGAPGPDGITLEAFIESFRHQWPTFPTKTLCTWSYQTSPTSYPLWIPTLCRHGLVQIFRPRRSHCVARKSIAEGKRSPFTSIDQSLFACRSDGRLPLGTID